MRPTGGNTGGNIDPRYLLLALGSMLLASSPAPGQERDFCTTPATCSPDLLAVRFGDPAQRRHEISGLRRGDTFDVTTVIEVGSEGIQGWSFSVAHDSSMLELVEVAVATEFFGDLFFSTTKPAVGSPPPGWITASVLPIFPPPGESLPVGVDVVVAGATYRVIADLGAFPATLSFADNLNPELGSPPVATNVTANNITLIPRAVIDGRVFGVSAQDPQVAYSRGDANGDGRIDLSDVVVLASNLFLGKRIRFDCRAMLDATADGQLGVSDPIAVIAWLFLSGPPLPDPFRACERAPTRGLGCEEPNCAPP